MPDARYTYVGDGTEFLFGVPARDLTAADLATLDDDQRANVKASPLYQSPPKATAAKADVPTEDAKKGKKDDALESETKNN